MEMTWNLIGDFGGLLLRVRETIYWVCTRTSVAGRQRVVITPTLSHVSGDAPGLVSHVGTPTSTSR